MVFEVDLKPRSSSILLPVGSMDLGNRSSPPVLIQKSAGLTCGGAVNGSPILPTIVASQLVISVRMPLIGHGERYLCMAIGAVKCDKLVCLNRPSKV
jgi:hypothetical protein